MAEANNAMVRELVDHFKTMAADVAVMPEFSQVVYVDLRKTLLSGANYRQYWENEMHPTGKGFHLIADCFVSVLDKI